MEYFGHENKGIVRVHVVHPGLIYTDQAVALEKHGLKFPYDDGMSSRIPLMVMDADIKCVVSLPGDFIVWVASEEAAFLRNKFIFADWDVDELRARRDEIEKSQDLTLGLNGFPRALISCAVDELMTAAPENNIFH